MTLVYDSSPSSPGDAAATAVEGGAVNGSAAPGQGRMTMEPPLSHAESVCLGVAAERSAESEGGKEVEVDVCAEVVEKPRALEVLEMEVDVEGQGDGQPQLESNSDEEAPSGCSRC